VTEEEYKKILSILNNEQEEELLKKLMLTNTELMEAVYDLQEFMEEKGLTPTEFQTWKEQKDLRMYH
jgi:hypothetical protein